MSSLDYLDLCRLCLVKDRVSVPIFEGEGDVRQIFLKIAACLPVKVGREDKLPKKICDDCVYKVELFYQFWNTTANAEKQLLQWLGEVSLDEKQGYVTGAHNSNMMKPGQNTGENRLDGSVMEQQVNDHTSGMGMGMMDGMGMAMPIMIPNSGQQSQSQQPMTSVPMDTGGNAVQTVQAVPGPSAQIAQQKINAPTSQEEDDDESEEEDNSDDECDGDDGLPVKEESEEEPGNRTIEPTTFVNVSLACDEAGPSGLQQQKIGEMPEMVMPSTDGDPKSGYIPPDPLGPDYLTVKIMDDFYRIPKSKCYMILTRPENGSKATSEKTPTNDLRSVVNVEKSFDDKTTRVSSSADEIATVKIEFPEDEEIASEPTTEKRGLNQNSDGTSSKRRKETTVNATAESSWDERNDSEDSDNDPLKDRESDRREDTEDDADAEKTGRIEISGSSNSQEVPRIGNSPRAAEKKKEGLSYECKPCGYKFSRRWKYERHMNTHDKKKPDPVIHECTTCKQSFPRKSAYNRHMLKHSTERPHKCDRCGKAYKTSSELKNHMQIHSGVMYTCEICNFTTAYKLSLKTHTRGVHEKDFPHKCDKCEKAYMSKYELADHVTSHLGTKSFVCELCGNAYTQKSHLVHHKRVVHGIRNRAPKNLKCEHCEKTFNTEYALQSHVSLHSQKFLCSQCGKEFANNQSLKLHTRMHTGERPYGCNMCSKAFTSSNALSIHKLTHTGERPYLCDLCDKSFTQRTTMMIHRRKHPGNHPPPPPTSLSKYGNALDTSS